MKNIPYIDILISLLPSDQREAFLQSYSQPIPKNITEITHKMGKNSPSILEGVRGSNRPGQHFLHQGGFFYIQESAASLPAQVLLQNQDTRHSSLAPHHLILDMCAAPGGKTIQLANSLLSPLGRGDAERQGGLSSSTGFVVANELIDPRRKALIFNINRCGCYNTAITNYDGTKIGSLAPDTFDKVLIDAPCSGEGMNYKIAIQQSRDEKKIKNIAATQYQLLKSGILACKPGGTIIYSTCTLNPIENEGVIANIMQEFSGKIELENVDIDRKSTGITEWNGERIIERNQADKQARFRPHIHHIGGFFIAKIKKLGESKITPSILQGPPSGGEGAGGSNEHIANKLLADFGITIDPKKHFFIQTANAVYLTSPLVQTLSLRGTKQSASPSLHIQKAGIPIYSIGTHIKKQFPRSAFRDPETQGWIPTHHLGNILGHLATKNVIELDDQQAQDYSDHKDLNIPVETFRQNVSTTGDKFFILRRKNFGFSIGKLVDGKIKNKMI